MDAVQQLESELKILDTPVVESAPEPDNDTPEITTVETSVVDPTQEAQKLKAAQTLAAALDQLGEHISTARAAAHGLVEAFTPVEPAGHPLTVETSSEEPKEPTDDDDEVPQSR